MGETTFRQVEAVFHEALERPPAERAAFLERACAGVAHVRREVERLLKLDDQEAGLLDSAPWKRESPEIQVTVDPLAQPGARLGRYRLLERIAVGGMGTVWLAERADEHFDQRVAVKLIKRGMDTDDILRRFRTERQVLAGLQHPRIARLLDGGATSDGRPYLVMEFIDGRPIDAYCDANALSLRQRIELFIKACRGVQVAHRNLVIHRDLKPSNIMVTEDGEPKLLDFGIAKLLSDEGAAVTATGLRVMTPMYASPEQIRGDRITTASDVYGLGVVLYELIAGRSPYQLTTQARSEIERAVLLQEPSRPSTVAGRQTASGDLDTIVLKALSKEPEARYGSPEQLADDLQRYLDGRPILARPAGVGTRIVKALRRNRRAVAAALAGGVLSLLGAVVVSVYLFIVPTWVQEHLDAARLELLDPGQSNAIYNSVYWHDADAGDKPPRNGLERAVSHYNTALRLYPMRDDIRLEREVVRRALGRPSNFDTSALDDRSRGLLALLNADYQSAFRAWSRLDLVSDPDPLVEGMLGILYLALDEPARAYPRLTNAYQALPEAGFLCVSLADAAVHCGDVDTAVVLIERAKKLSKVEDNTGGLQRVEADVLAATGRYEEAAAIYEAILSTPVACLHYADMLEGQGQTREALAALARGIRDVTELMKVNRLFRKRAERWWVGLSSDERAALIEVRHHDDPTDRASFSALLYAYRVATLALERRPAPVDPIGRPPRYFAQEAEVRPTFDDLSATLAITDVKSWVLADHYLDDDLDSRVKADLAGPGRTLSAETRRDYLAWERAWRANSPPNSVRKTLSFAPGE
ncbi:MAG: protein kinase domain-containing protein [Planctomycetota bacterium]|jgi:tetratricopeptide (TPR) repeat protein